MAQLHCVSNTRPFTTLILIDKQNAGFRKSQAENSIVAFGTVLLTMAPPFLRGLLVSLSLVTLLVHASCQDCTHTPCIPEDAVIPYVRVQYSPVKHCRGVFALKDYAEGEIVEHAPMVLVNTSLASNMGMLYDYVFSHSEYPDINILALGYLSLFNHDEEYNVVYDFDYEREIIITKARILIKKGEEMTVHYGDSWWKERPHYSKM